MKKTCLPLIIILFISLNGFSQSKKIIKNKKIKSIKTIIYDFSAGSGKNHIKEIVYYDEKGNITEKIDYDKEGQIKKHTENIYDENDNLLTRTFFFANGKVKKVNKYVYDRNLKTAKLVYDNKGNLVLKEEYIYEIDIEDNK